MFNDLFRFENEMNYYAVNMQGDGPDYYGPYDDFDEGPDSLGDTYEYYYDEDDDPDSDYNDWTQCPQ